MEINKPKPLPVPVQQLQTTVSQQSLFNEDINLPTTINQSYQFIGPSPLSSLAEKLQFISTHPVQLHYPMQPSYLSKIFFINYQILTQQLYQEMAIILNKENEKMYCFICMTFSVNKQCRN